MSKASKDIIDLLVDVSQKPADHFTTIKNTIHRSPGKTSKDIKIEDLIKNL